MTSAYHFLNADMTANSGNEPPWKEGEERKIADVSREIAAMTLREKRLRLTNYDAALVVKRAYRTGIR